MGVAVKVTLAPEQIAPDGLAAIVTDGATTGKMVIVILLEVAVVGDAQPALDVITAETTSPLFSVVDVNVAPLPALVPFTCHW